MDDISPETGECPLFSVKGGGLVRVLFSESFQSLVQKAFHRRGYLIAVSLNHEDVIRRQILKGLAPV